MPQLVLLHQEGSLAILTLNRPERHNSLIPALLNELLARLETIRDRPDVQAVVLLANGRSFSTGGDVRGFYDHMDGDLVVGLEAYAQKLVGLLNQVILAMVELPVPVVTAVQGIVTGGSMGLVLASDLVLVVPEASFTPYYSVVGFSPDGGWTAMAPAIIGSRRAAEILMLNHTITAQEAVAWGLANRLVPGKRIREEARQVAREITAKKAGSVQHIKRLLTAGLGNLADRLELERVDFVRQITTPEAMQGIRDFLE